MFRFIIAATVAVSLTACPGPVADPYPPYEDGPQDNRKMDPRFAGEWAGSYVFDVDGKSVETGAASLHVDVDGPYVTVHGVCPSGTETIRAEGNGAATIWYGDITCTTPTLECPGATTRSRSAVVRVLESGELYLLFQGTTSACGKDIESSIEVRATK